MPKYGKVIAVAVLLSLVSSAGQAWAAPASEALLPSRTIMDLAGSAAVPAAGVMPGAVTAAHRGAIRDTLEGLRQSPPALLPGPPAPAAAAAQATGGRGLSTTAKAAIWLTAITVAGVWGYKTFSVTRGTD
jgi:hypothetical protein